MGYIFDNLNIKNFKGFKDSTTIEIGQINVLTGKNNAGKSSFIELINLLYSSFGKGGITSLNFSTLEKFLSFDKVLNYNSTSNEIILTFPTTLEHFGPKNIFHIELTFVKSLNNPLDGFLKSYKYYYVNSKNAKKLVFELEINEYEHQNNLNEGLKIIQNTNCAYFCNIGFIINKVKGLISLVKESAENTNVKEAKIEGTDIPFSFKDLIESTIKPRDLLTNFYSKEYDKIKFKSSEPYIKYFDFKELIKDYGTNYSINSVLKYRSKEKEILDKYRKIEESIELRGHIFAAAINPNIPFDQDPEIDVDIIKDHFESFIIHELAQNNPEQIDFSNEIKFNTPFFNLLFDSIIGEILTPLFSRKGSVNPVIVDVSRVNNINYLLKHLYNRNISSDNIEYHFFKFWLNEFGYGSDYKLIEENDGITITFDNEPLNSLGRGLNSLLKTLITIICSAHDNYGGMNLLYSPSLLILIEPESNLHPDLQSKLADLLVDASNKFDMRFIVESHSEYLIRKLQYWTSIGKIKPGDTKLNYFEKDLENKTILINQIEIDDDGNLSDKFGSGFVDHAPKLMLDLLNLKKKNNLN